MKKPSAILTLWLPPKLAYKLGTWSAWRQLQCPHPEHRERRIWGDERMMGFMRQCMDCGQLEKELRNHT